MEPEIYGKFETIYKLEIFVYVVYTEFSLLSSDTKLGIGFVC